MSGTPKLSSEDLEHMWNQGVRIIHDPEGVQWAIVRSILSHQRPVRSFFWPDAQQFYREAFTSFHLHRMETPEEKHQREIKEAMDAVNRATERLNSLINGEK